MILTNYVKYRLRILIIPRILQDMRKEFEQIHDAVLPAGMIEERHKRVAIGICGLVYLADGKIDSDEHGTAGDKLKHGLNGIAPDLAPFSANEIKNCLAALRKTGIRYQTANTDATTIVTQVERQL